MTAICIRPLAEGANPDPNRVKAVVETTCGAFKREYLLGWSTLFKMLRETPAEGVTVRLA